jgi:uncharacterized protein YdiU (UPF0061 family)
MSKKEARESKIGAHKEYQIPKIIEEVMNKSLGESTSDNASFLAKGMFNENNEVRKKFRENFSNEHRELINNYTQDTNQLFQQGNKYSVPTKIAEQINEKIKTSEYKLYEVLKPLREGKQLTNMKNLSLVRL